MFLLFVCTFLLVPASQARTWLVSKTDPRGVKSFYDLDYDRMQPGDIVVVRPGVYKEVIQAVNGIKYLARGKVFIDEIRIENSFGVTIDGFRLDGDKKKRQTGISVVDSKKIKILNCRIREFEEGISISRSQNVTIEKVLINDTERGLFLFRANRVTLKRSLIAHLPPRRDVVNADVGIEINGGSIVTIDHNTLVRNGGAAIVANGADRMKFTNNIVAFNGWGLQIESPGNRIFDHNLLYKNSNGDQKESPFPGTPLPLSKGIHFFFNPAFVDSEIGDWRLENKSSASKKDRNGSYLGAFPPVPPSDEL